MIDQQVRDATIKALISGALSGGALGAGARVLGGARKLRDIAGPALGAAAASGGIAGGSTYLGSQLMGAPDPEETSGFTHRGALGGALGGGALGGVLGAGAASGIVKPPMNNLVTDYFKRLARKPSRAGILKGAAAGALGLGGLAGYLGSDEGMQVDFLNEEIKRRMRQRMGE